MNAFDLGQKLPLTAPTRAMTLGLVPQGYATLAEVCLGLEEAIMIKICGEGADVRVVPDTVCSFSVSSVLDSLVTRETEAVVDFGKFDRLHRIPAACWHDVWVEFGVHSNWCDARFSRVLRTGCVFGPEFGAYDGATPCMSEAHRTKLVKTYREMFQPDRATTRMLSRGDVERQPKPRLNVPIGRLAPSKWVVDEEVERMAATRLRARRESESEKYIRSELQTMLDEQGVTISPASLAARRNYAGRKIRSR